MVTLFTVCPVTKALAGTSTVNVVLAFALEIGNNFWFNQPIAVLLLALVPSTHIKELVPVVFVPLKSNTVEPVSNVIVVAFDVALATVPVYVDAL